MILNKSMPDSVQQQINVMNTTTIVVLSLFCAFILAGFVGTCAAAAYNCKCFNMYYKTSIQIKMLGKI